AENREYYDQCMKIASQLQQIHSLSLLGEIPNPLDLIAASDIIASPSPQSHFSRPVIEAWALGKPVVAARTAHIIDLMNDGVDGLLVNPKAPGELAQSLGRLLEDDELCNRLGRAGMKRATEEFGNKNNLDMIVDRCNSLIRS
ncbi:MAG: glycosyltransferase family 4 protein, partial [Bacteroidota bacterium]